MNRKRTWNEKKQDGLAHYRGLEAMVSDKAMAIFKAKPYQTVKGSNNAVYNKKGK